MNTTLTPARTTMEQLTNATAGGVISLNFLGVSLADWASICAILWFLIQAAFKIYDRFKDKE